MNDERRTPRWLFDRLNKVFHFTLDAAASRDNALLPKFYTKEDNAFRQNWYGETVWCNPPYSRGQGGLTAWVTKALPHKCAMLLPGDCSTVAGQSALHNATAILFLNRRLKFDNEPSGAKFSSWVAFFNLLIPSELDDLGATLSIPR
jgi:phage N-6-adenine-methyltransferase